MLVACWLLPSIPVQRGVARVVESYGLPGADEFEDAKRQASVAILLTPASLERTPPSLPPCGSSSVRGPATVEISRDSCSRPCSIYLFIYLFFNSFKVHSEIGRVNETLGMFVAPAFPGISNCATLLFIFLMWRIAWIEKSPTNFASMKLKSRGLSWFSALGVFRRVKNFDGLNKHCVYSRA